MTFGAFLASHLGELVAMGSLLVASGFFSGSETALFNLTRGQLHRLRQGHGNAAAVLMSQPRRTLNVLLLGNLLVNVAYTGFSATIIFDLPRLGLSPWVVAAASLVPLLVLILCGEVGPKMLAYALQERWAVPSAPIVRLAAKILAVPLLLLEYIFIAPLTRIFAPRRAEQAEITADELASVLNLSAKRGIISHDANALLQEIIELTDLRVNDIMVPRVDMVAYNVDETPEGLLELFRKTRLRRIPVYEGSIDNILGLIHAKQLLAHRDLSLRQLVTAVHFVPETGNIERLLVHLRAKTVQMAIVVDEYSGTAGLVTLQDILEEIVGRLPEPGEKPDISAVEQIDEKTYLINADLAIHEWADAFKIDLSGRRISTLGGFVTSQLGRIAKVGDTLSYRNLLFTVETMHRSRIGKLRLELLEEPS